MWCLATVRARPPLTICIVGVGVWRGGGKAGETDVRCNLRQGWVVHDLWKPLPPRRRESSRRSAPRSQCPRQRNTRDNTWPRGDAPSPPTTPRGTPPPRPQPLLEPRQTCRWTKGSTNKMGNKREIHRGTAGHKGAGTPSDAHPAVPAGRRRLHRLPTQLCSRQAHPPYSTHTSPATHMRTGSASTPPGGRPLPSPHNRHQRVGSFRGRESGSRRRPHPPGPQPRRVQLGPLARPLPP